MGVIVVMAIQRLFAIGPCKLCDGFLMGSILFLVKFFDLEVDLAHDVAVGQGHSGGIDRLVAPLH